MAVVRHGAEWSNVLQGIGIDDEGGIEDDEEDNQDGEWDEGGVEASKDSKEGGGSGAGKGWIRRRDKVVANAQRKNQRVRQKKLVVVLDDVLPPHAKRRASSNGAGIFSSSNLASCKRDFALEIRIYIAIATSFATAGHKQILDGFCCCLQASSCASTHSQSFPRTT